MQFTQSSNGEESRTTLEKILPTPKFNMKKVEFPATSQYIIYEEGQDLIPITPKQYTEMRL